MITITMNNGDIKRISGDEYTEYEVNYGFFIVISGCKWVGMYALRNIASVEISK